MKKFFTFVLALAAAVTLNAATQVTFDFSDATAYDYANPEKGAYTQVTTGSVLTQDGVTLTISFEEGNGFRFFSNTNSGVVNLRAYVNSSFVLAAPEGKKIAAVAIDGSNLNATYLAGDITAKNWSDATGKASLTTNVIKSTVQFNTMTVTLIEEGEIPETPKYDTLNVAAAIAEAEKLANNATSTKPYYVEGYAVNVETYSKDYHNQDFFLVDNAAAPDSKFQAYRATPKKNDAEYPVLAGDKLRLFGSLKKYVKDDKVQLEIVEPTVEFLSEVEGDRTIGGGGETPDPEKLDTITVAKALEIGETLENGKATDVQYVIKGYVSNIARIYDAVNKNEDFWIVDEKGGTAASNADGAFYVYRGKPDTEKEVGLNAYVYVTTKIQKYGSANTIESWSNSPVKVVEQGEVEEIESIDVAKALEIGKTLADGGVSEKNYEITGYVSHIYTFFSADFKNETFFISDDPTSTSSENAFEVYRGKSNKAAEVGWGAKVKLTCKIKNYKGTIENDGSNIAFEVLEESTYEPELISSEKAAEIANALAEGAKTPKYYIVKGFIQEAGTFDTKNNTATYKLSDFPNDAEASVTAYKATVLKADAEKVATLNNYVNVTGYLMKHSTAQIAQGAITEFVEAPQMDTIHVDVAGAIAAGLELPMGGKSDRIYAVTGFVNFVSEEFAEGVESFFLADDATSDAYTFFASAASIDKAVEAGHQVEIVGRLQNPDGETVTIDHGKARYIPGEGIENIVLTEKAQKVVVDGVIYIVRDNKMFDVRGTQVR